MRINKQVIAWLRKVSSGNTRVLDDVSLGLCWNLRKRYVKFYCDILHEWLLENYGEHNRYPVEHPSMSREKAFKDTHNLWKNTEGTKDNQIYIQNRLKLVSDFADYLEGIS